MRTLIRIFVFQRVGSSTSALPQAEVPPQPRFPVYQLSPLNAPRRKSRGLPKPCLPRKTSIVPLSASKLTSSGLTSAPSPISATVSSECTRMSRGVLLPRLLVHQLSPQRALGGKGEYLNPAYQFINCHL
jgi:hypothetical protein